MLDVLVAWRERLLDWVLGVPRWQALNAEVPQGSPALAAQAEGGDLAATLRQAANDLKRAAVSPDGAAVDYTRLAGSEVYAAYRASAARLRAFDPLALASRQEKLAFWINLYNALVIHAVLALGVRRSVAEGRLGLLAFFRRAAYNVGGRRVSCEDIEHGILRANRGNPAVPGPHFGPSDPRRVWVVSPPDVRVHFALNCASRSCPPIRFYDAQRIEAQLDLAARSYLSSTVTVDPKGDALSLPRIFRWYAGDFGGRSGVIDFLLHYLPEDNLREWLRGRKNTLRLKYLPYDWSLNAIQAGGVLPGREDGIGSITRRYHHDQTA